MRIIRFFELIFFITAIIVAAPKAVVPPQDYAFTLEELGIIYLSTIKSIVHDQLCPVTKHPKYKNNPAYYDGLTAQYGKQISAAYHVPHTINFISQEVGYGVFATEDIEEGQMIGEYTGVICTTRQMTKRDGKQAADYAWDYPKNPKIVDEHGHCIKKSKELSVDAFHEGNFTRFVNHSYYPNVMVLDVPYNNQWHVIYVAFKPIKKGEQLFVNYGKEYWSSRKCLPCDFTPQDTICGSVYQNICKVLLAIFNPQ